MVILYSLNVFVSAFLLFLIQPLFAKMILPLLGGSSAVWNTCMVFFQTVLLLGYCYAHLSTKKIPVKVLIVLHLGLLLLPLIILPIRIPQGWTPPTESNPIPWVLSLLSLAVGIPFFAVSTTAPLMQKWFSLTRHAQANDPYFLYAASNLGSFLCLLSYPFLIEPNITLSEQSGFWTLGYFLFLTLTFACAGLLLKSYDLDKAKQALESEHLEELPSLSWSKKIRWVFLAFVPSSLLLGITTFISTDIAAIPLFWILPLTLYLLTFVLVFATKPAFSHAAVIKTFSFMMVPLSMFFASGLNQPIGLLLPLHLLTFFFASMMLHGELAQERPDSKHLTVFYLCLSIGGMLGGVFNALVAPLIFSTVVEYPLALVLACFLRPSLNSKTVGNKIDFIPPSIFAAVVAFFLFVIFPTYRIEQYVFPRLMTFAIAAVICYAFRDRPVRFALGMGALLALGAIPPPGEKIIHTERSFFGVNTVKEDSRRRHLRLLHGTTLHGLQSLDPELRGEPLSYFHRSGPMGEIFESIKASTGDSGNIGVVGLGAGTLAAYASPSDKWTFYEIDPAVYRIANNPNFFTFLRNCLAPNETLMGDGRLSLQRAQNQNFDLLILDAFSSDAIPMHLVSREALKLYISKLAPAGVLVFNISNRYLDLRPVLAALAKDAGLAHLTKLNLVSQEEAAKGFLSSSWFVMAKRREVLAGLAARDGWNQVPSSDNRKALWTDDYSNLLVALKSLRRSTS